ncbi:MAG: dual specificity protein phosphatase family protein [Actinomycetota bacterium]|nr:dual specificity protein phosphatase family protein [Actinomycetota bacterium]
MSEEVRTSESHAIYADFVPVEELGTPGRLGMTLAPGKKADSIFGFRWERDLETDLRVLKEAELAADVLVSLMEEHEYHEFEIPDLFTRDDIGGVEILRFAIVDGRAPLEEQAQEFEVLIRTIISRLEGNSNVVAHCRGGLGRTGTVAACVLVAMGRHSADTAMKVIRKARRDAIEPGEQEEYVRKFEQRVRTQASEAR